MDGTSVTGLVADLLFNTGAVTRDAIAACDPEVFAETAEREQVVPLLVAPVQRFGVEPHLAALQARARRWTLHEALERDVIRALLDGAEGVRTLFFKGASLAYATYDAPADRMRVDWDILIDAADERAVDRALRAAGFEKDLKTPRGLRNRQQSYRRRAGAGECTVDLHTGILNAPSLASRIRFDQLAARSVPLPLLHPLARGIDEADALAIACLHRLTHHSEEERLIWDYDITRLAERVEGDAVLLAALIDRAREWQVGPLVAIEVVRARTRTGMDMPARRAAWVETLVLQPCDVMEFARPGRSRSDDFLIHWRRLGWKDRVSLVREALLPDPQFVRESTGSSLPLPLLYARRAVRGAAAWFRRPGPKARRGA